MLRIAWGNGFKVHSFYAHFFGRALQIWNRDVDHYAPDWLVEGLSRHTGVPPARVESMTLRSFEGVVFEKLNPNRRTRLLLPMGVYHRTRFAFGQQFCPHCLQEDTEPYLRQRWRLALIAVCTRHGVLLGDRCTNCDQPLAPHRGDMISRRCFPDPFDMAHCGYCCAKLESHGGMATNDEIAVQRGVEQVMDQGYTTLNIEGPVYSHLYFDGLWLLMRSFVVPKGESTKRKKEFERGRPRERIQSLCNVVKLLEKWPERFLEHCHSLRRAYSHLTKEGDALPYWLGSVARSQLLILGGGSRKPRRTLAPVGDRQSRALLAWMDRKIINEPMTSRRLVLQRDRTMFSLARSLCLHLTRLVATSMSDIDSILSDASPLLRLEIQAYVDTVRPQFALKRQCEVLFLTHTCKPMSATATSERFDRILRMWSKRGCRITWSQWIGKTH